MSKIIRDYLNHRKRNDPKSDSIFDALTAAERADAREMAEVSDTMVIEVPKIVLCDLDEVVATE